MTWHTQPLVSWDTETTGIDIETARIVTSAFVWRNADGTHDTSTLLADPGIEIPAEATAVHGISTEQARAEGKPAVQVVEDITDRLHTALAGGMALVVMNARYDLSLLDRECRRHGLLTLEQRLGRPIGPVIDPFVIDKQADKYRKGSRKLEALAVHYGVELTDAHTADADALAAVQVAVAIAERYPQLQVDAALLHGWQIDWAERQAEDFQAYKRRTDPTAVIDGSWPLTPYREPAPVPHQPTRGDAVEAWLKQQRDRHLDNFGRNPTWYALDDLLDAYRLHADNATPLGEDGVR